LDLLKFDVSLSVIDDGGVFVTAFDDLTEGGVAFQHANRLKVLSFVGPFGGLWRGLTLFG
jgi:hypothetical protein